MAAAAAVAQAAKGQSPGFNLRTDALEARARARARWLQTPAHHEAGWASVLKGHLLQPCTSCCRRLTTPVAVF